MSKIKFIFSKLICLSFYFYHFIFSKKFNQIYVFDIDNTLALSDPFIYRNGYNITNVPVNESLKNLLVRKQIEKNKIIILSHRSYFDYVKTLEWINKNISKDISFLDIIFVPSPNYKLFFLKLFSKRSDVFYFDDLHYGFELSNGPFPYNYIIKEVKKINIKYYDYNFIKNEQKN
jgi:hypothetical protein